MLAVVVYRKQQGVIVRYPSHLRGELTAGTMSRLPTNMEILKNDGDPGSGIHACFREERCFSCVTCVLELLVRRDKTARPGG